MASGEDYIGSTSMVAFPFAPRNWALAQGQSMPINQNQALFALIWTIYGGDGRTYFNLPDMRGRVPVGQGAGTGLSPRNAGQAYGQEQVSLVAGNLPAHTHPVQLGGSGAADNSGGPAVQGTTKGVGGGVAPAGLAGDSMPVPTTPPSLVVTWIVCLYGIFPSRD